MTIVDVWVVHETTDEFGRIGKCLGVFRSEFFADEAAKGKGWWGGPGRVLKKKAFVTSDSEVYVLEGDAKPLRFADEEAERELREKALGKLSASERKLLGL